MRRVTVGLQLKTGLQYYNMKDAHARTGAGREHTQSHRRAAAQNWIQYKQKYNTEDARPRTGAEFKIVLLF